MLRWLGRWWDGLTHEASVPTAPFKASKRIATIMYGLWYGRLTPTKARDLAAGWGLSPDSIADMIARCTQPPSYWATHAAPDAEPGAAHGASRHAWTSMATSKSHRCRHARELNVRHQGK